MGRLSFQTLPLTGHTPYSDGGNIEGPYRSFVDDIYPGTNITYCEQAWASKNFAPNATPAGGFSASSRLSHG